MSGPLASEGSANAPLLRELLVQAPRRPGPRIIHRQERHHKVWQMCAVHPAFDATATETEAAQTTASAATGGCIMLLHVGSFSAMSAQPLAPRFGLQTATTAGSDPARWRRHGYIDGSGRRTGDAAVITSAGSESVIRAEQAGLLQRGGRALGRALALE